MSVKVSKTKAAVEKAELELKLAEEAFVAARHSAAERQRDLIAVSPDDPNFHNVVQRLDDERLREDAAGIRRKGLADQLVAIRRAHTKAEHAEAIEKAGAEVEKLRAIGQRLSDKVNAFRAELEAQYQAEFVAQFEVAHQAFGALPRDENEGVFDYQRRHGVSSPHAATHWCQVRTGYQLDLLQQAAVLTAGIANHERAEREHLAARDPAKLERERKEREPKDRAWQEWMAARKDQSDPPPPQALGIEIEGKKP